MIRWNSLDRAAVAVMLPPCAVQGWTRALAPARDGPAFFLRLQPFGHGPLLRLPMQIAAINSAASPSSSGNDYTDLHLLLILLPNLNSSVDKALKQLAFGVLIL